LIQKSNFILGYFNPSDAPKNPEILAQGLHITHGTYFRITGEWAQSNSLYSFIFMWLFPTNGIIGTFTDFMISVSIKTTNFHRVVISTTNQQIFTIFLILSDIDKI
jgi:hypothetical protein